MDKEQSTTHVEDNNSSEANPLPFAIQSGNIINSTTFETARPPQGVLMHLHLANVQPEESHAAPPSAESQLFGTHLREAVAIIKDWKKRP
jgi:hypothetical protein